MPATTEVVSISISRQTAAVTQAGFGIPMIFGEHAVFAERLRFYTDTASLLTDGFESTDAIYLAAVAMFAQNPGVDKIAVGRRQVDVVGISIDTVIDNTDYVVKVDSTTFTYNSGVSATNLTIAAGLVALIDAHADYTATDDTDGTFTISHATAGTGFAVNESDANLSIEKPLATVDTIADDLTAISEYDNTWYGLIMPNRTQADVEAAALWVEANKKLFVTATSDVASYDSGSSTDLMAKLKTAAYERTAVIFSATPTDYPDAAWMALQFATDPGSSTWAFKTLSAVTVDSLTTTQDTNIRAKNGNTYTVLGGINATYEGKVASGEYIDIIRGIDWLEARMRERILNQLLNLPKIPMTDPGIGIIETEVRAQLQDGVAAGLLAADPAPTVTVPLAANVSTADKAARTLNGVSFDATLAGAIHKVSVSGVVTL